jgi:hypothetical protein
MTDEERKELERLKARSDELAQTHQGLRLRRAEVSELSADVHDEAARVHDALAERSLLDPAGLRAHADRDRAIAEEERTALAEELAPEGP